MSREQQRQKRETRYRRTTKHKSKNEKSTFWIMGIHEMPLLKMQYDFEQTSRMGWKPFWILKSRNGRIRLYTNERKTRDKIDKKVRDILLNVNFNLQPSRECTRDRQNGLKWRWKKCRRWEQCILRPFFMLITHIFPRFTIHTRSLWGNIWILFFGGFFCSLVLNLTFGSQYILYYITN